MNISNYIDAYNGLGNVYGKKKGMYKEAEKVFLNFVGLTPKSYNAYYNLGLVYSKQDLYEKEIQAFRKAIEINPKNYHGFLKIAQLYEKQGLNAMAVTEYKKALALPPQDKALMKTIENMERGKK